MCHGHPYRGNKDGATVQRTLESGDLDLELFPHSHIIWDKLLHLHLQCGEPLVQVPLSGMGQHQGSAIVHPQ